MTVLVTGAAGVLGRAVIAALARRGAQARGAGRGARPPAFPADWRTVDLLTGVSLEEAMNDVSVVVHCASNPRRPHDDLRMIETLLPVTGRRRCSIVFVGIAGIEDATAFDYYKVKLDCEAVLSGSGVTHAICRATQFHELVDYLLRSLTRGPITLLPKITLQPVDVRFVGERLAEHALTRAEGRTPVIHGPETLTSWQLADDWSAARRVGRVRVPLPALGPFKALKNLRAVQGDSGGATWREWLTANPGGPSPYRTS